MWLVVVLGVAARARPGAQAALCCATAAGTALSLPPRLWVPQLRRLALLCLLLFTMTALGAGAHLTAPELHALRQRLRGGGHLRCRVVLLGVMVPKVLTGLHDLEAYM